MHCVGGAGEPCCVVPSPLQRVVGGKAGQGLAEVELVVDVAGQAQALHEGVRRLVVAIAGQQQPGVVDQRLDETAVVALTAAQFEGLLEVLLGGVEASVHHVVPALLGQRGRRAVGITGLPVERPGLGSEHASAFPFLGALTCAGLRQESVGKEDRIAGLARRGDGGVADAGGVGGGDEDGAAPESDQSGGLDGWLAGIAGGF